MKKFIAILFFFVATMQDVFAQSNNADNAIAALANYKNPIERFTETILYLEAIDASASSDIDSAVCIDLLQIAQQLKNDSLLATSYNWIGYFFSVSKGDNTTALEYYFKALPLAEKYNDKRRISSLYFDIAGVYFSLNNYDDYFKATLKGGANLPDKASSKYNHMLVQYQRNMGTYYLNKGQLDSTLFYAQEAAQTSEQLKKRIFRIQTLTLLAVTYARMDENALADVYFDKAQIVADSIALRKEIFYRRYIPYLANTNRMNEAKWQTGKFWEVAGRSQNLNVKLLAATYKKELFDKLRQTDSAYHYSKIESEVRDLIFNQDNQNAMQAMAFKEQLRVMEDTAKKSEEEQQRRQNIQFALLAIGIVTFLILFFLLSRSIIVTEKWISFFGILGLLIVFEFINLLMHPFLDRVTNHSPFLMLIALVALASLLIPLHHRMERWIKEKMTEKNKRIRLDNAKKTIEKLGGEINSKIG